VNTPVLRGPLGTGEKPAQSRYWLEEEHERFLKGVEMYGRKNFKAIAAFVGSRDRYQVRTHMQKYLLRLEREAQILHKARAHPLKPLPP